MENLTVSVEAEKMLIGLSGKVDSSNAGDIQKSIEESLAANGHVSHVVLDAADLTYISSAGLRILISLEKMIPDFSVINASRDVYDILEMTGLVNLFKVSRALREISIDGLEIIGQGTCGTVYRLDRETIVKVFTEGFDIKKIESERENSQKSLLNGIDTAISYDIVKVGNQYGVVYEMIDADTFRSVIRNDPGSIDRYIGIYAEFVRGMHGTHFEPGMLMPVKPDWYGSVDKMSVFSGEEKALVRGMINAVDDRNTFVHGDCNVGNLMFKNDSVVLIDMADASVGHPVFDLAGIYLGFVLVPMLIPEEFCEHMTGFTRAQNLAMWNRFCEVYFDAGTEEERSGYGDQIKPFAAFRLIQTSLVVSIFPDEMIQDCRKIVLDANSSGIHRLKF